ncbi:MAG: DoxX family membrane protein [Chloroflexota bacterium]
MNVKQFEGNLFGVDVKTEYNALSIAYAIVLMRVVMGWVMFQGGIVKVIDPEWTAAGFLQFAIPEGNPFMNLWANFAGSPLIDGLVAWGLTLTGLGLMLGALTRWNAFWAAFMMIMFWMASLQGGLAEFLPLEHGWVVNDHIVYAIVLFGLGALGSGRILGVDSIIEKSEFVKNNGFLKLFLG